MGRVVKVCAMGAWVALFLGGIPASSQSLTSLQGKVTDPGGSAVPSAAVRLTNSANNSERTATTDQTGSYSFFGVTPGKYRLRVDAQGFEEFEESDVDLTGSAPKTADIKLQIEQVQQSVTVRGQENDECLQPQGRILPDVGPGLRALRTGPSGNYYALTAPGTVAIYSPDGKPVGRVPAASPPGSSIVNGVDLQVDPAGRVYVADSAANAIKIYSAEGTLEKTIRVSAPLSVEPLPGGEVAVASMFSKNLADVYDEEHGERYRSIGEPPPSVVQCDQSSLTCTMATKISPPNSQPAANRVWFYGDSTGNLYINLADVPSPTVRKYDAYGYLSYESTIPLVRSSGSNSGWSINPDVRLAEIGTIGLGADASQSYSTTSSGNNSSCSTDGTTSSSCGRGMFGGGDMRGMGGGGGVGKECEEGAEACAAAVPGAGKEWSLACASLNGPEFRKQSPRLRRWVLIPPAGKCGLRLARNWFTSTRKAASPDTTVFQPQITRGSSQTRLSLSPIGFSLGVTLSASFNTRGLTSACPMPLLPTNRGRAGKPSSTKRAGFLRLSPVQTLLPLRGGN